MSIAVNEIAENKVTLRGPKSNTVSDSESIMNDILEHEAQEKEENPDENA